MKNLTIVGAVLLILGAAMLVYQGFSFTRDEKVIDAGPIQLSAAKREHVSFPPILGWVVTGAGVVVLVAGLKSAKA